MNHCFTIFTHTQINWGRVTSNIIDITHTYVKYCIYRPFGSVIILQHEHIVIPVQTRDSNIASTTSTWFKGPLSSHIPTTAPADKVAPSRSTEDFTRHIYLVKYQIILRMESCKYVTAHITTRCRSLFKT